MAKSSRFKLRWWHVFGSLIVICAGGSGAVYFGIMSSGKRAVQEEEKLAAADGMVLDTKGLRPIVPVPEDSNAYVALDNLMPVLQATNFKESSFGVPIRKAFGPLPAQTQADLAKVESLIPKIVLASKKPEYASFRNYDDGENLQFKDLSVDRQMVKILCFEALKLADQGRYDEAFDRLSAGQRLSRLISREPLFLPVLVGIGAETNIYSAVNDILLWHGKDPKVLDLAQVLVSDKPRPYPIKGVICGEMVLMRVALHDALKHGTEAISSDQGMESAGMGLVRFMIASPAYNPGIEARIMKADRIIFENLPNDTTDFDAIRKAYVLGEQQIDSDHSVYAPAVQTLSPVYSGVADSLERLDAHRKLVAAAIDMLRTRQKDGKFPAKAPVSKSEEDPFSGKPFLIAKTKDGLVIYSVGFDKVDGKGDPSKDITFRLTPK